MRTDGGGHVVLTAELWEKGRRLFQGNVQGFFFFFLDEQVVLNNDQGETRQKQTTAITKLENYIQIPKLNTNVPSFFRFLRRIKP